MWQVSWVVGAPSSLISTIVISCLLSCKVKKKRGKEIRNLRGGSSPLVFLVRFLQRSHLSTLLVKTHLRRLWFLGICAGIFNRRLIWGFGSSLVFEGSVVCGGLVYFGHALRIGHRLGLGLDWLSMEERRTSWLVAASHIYVKISHPLFFSYDECLVFFFFFLFFNLNSQLYSDLFCD